MENILVVEDYKGIRFLISEVLRNQGYQVEVAVGKEILRKMVQYKPKLLIIDAQALRVSDVNSIKEIAKENQTQFLMTTTTTTYNNVGIKQFENLSLKHINKPFDIEELIDVVNQLMNTQYEEIPIKHG